MARTNGTLRLPSLDRQVFKRKYFPSGPSWEDAVKITDNRLRAMRFWLENGDRSMSNDLKDMLISSLEALADIAKLPPADWRQFRRHEDNSEEMGIRELVALIETLDTEDHPTFARVYEFVGLPVPEIVRSSSIWFTGLGRSSDRNPRW